MDVNFTVSWRAAGVVAAALSVSAASRYLPASEPLGTAALESAVFMAPFCVDPGPSQSYYKASSAYGAVGLALALAGIVSPWVAFLAASSLLLFSARWSFRVSAAVGSVLNLFVSLPPGRYAQRRSMFLDCYVSNCLLVLAALMLAASFLASSWFLALAGVVALFFSFYWGLLRDDANRSFESELPFLMILASFYSSAGHRGLESALESVSSASSKVFAGLGLARLSYLRERLFSAPDPGKALSRFASRQKDKALSQIVDGYRTVSATGGDVYAYLVQQTDRALTSFEESRLERVRTTRGIAEVLLLTLALAPSVALTISVIGLNGAFTLYALASALPVAAVLALAMVDLYLPPMRDSLGVSWSLPVGLAASAAVLWWGAGGASVPFTLAGASVAFLVPVSIQYQMDSNAARRDEKDSLRMITSLVESLRIGKSVHEALQEAARNEGHSSFRRLVADFNVLVRLGMPPPEAGARVDSKSWVSRASFVVIGHAMVLGGGLEIVERFRSFLVKYVDSWTTVRREALWTAALAASLPFVTLGGVSVINTLQASFVGSAEPSFGFSLQVLPLQTILLAFIEVSALAAVLSSKLAGLTIKAAPVALAVMAATLASLVVYGLA
jgi:hypothetical protein